MLRGSNIFGEGGINKKYNVNSFTIQDVIEDFLESISKSDLNCFVVKGCMALNNHFLNNKLPYARMTQDLDLHYYSRDDWERFVEESSLIATKNSLLGLSYRLISRRGFAKNANGDSLKFEASDGNTNFIFKVDMNFGGNIDFVNYNNSISFYSIPVILSDKLWVLSSQKICRRVKDLIDIYLISSNFNLNYVELCCKISNRLNESGRIINFSNLYILTESSIGDMKHAFDRYDQSVNIGLSFEELYNHVLNFVIPIYFYLNGNVKDFTKWDCSKKEWF